jgi:hypothetical protein
MPKRKLSKLSELSNTPEIIQSSFAMMNDDCISSIFKLLDIDDLINIYNTGNNICRKVIEEYPFNFYRSEIPANMTLKEFRNIFKNAVGVCLFYQRNINDKEFIENILPHNINKYQNKRILYVDISDCTNLTNKAIKRLTNYIHTLDLENCNNITNNGFKYLKGIQSINISGLYKITNEAFKYLTGIKSLEMEIDENCEVNNNITGEIFKYLKGIEKLYIGGNYNILDNSYQHLTGINNINISHNDVITDEAFTYFRGVKYIELGDNNNLTSNFLNNLLGFDVFSINDKNEFDELIKKNNIIIPTIAYIDFTGLPDNGVYNAINQFYKLTGDEMYDEEYEEDDDVDEEDDEEVIDEEVIEEEIIEE